MNRAHEVSAASGLSDNGTLGNSDLKKERPKASEHLCG